MFLLCVQDGDTAAHYSISAVYRQGCGRYAAYLKFGTYPALRAQFNPGATGAWCPDDGGHSPGELKLTVGGKDAAQRAPGQPTGPHRQHYPRQGGHPLSNSLAPGERAGVSDCRPFPAPEPAPVAVTATPVDHPQGEPHPAARPGEREWGGRHPSPEHLPPLSQRRRRRYWRRQDAKNPGAEWPWVAPLSHEPTRLAVGFGLGEQPYRSCRPDSPRRARKHTLVPPLLMSRTRLYSRAILLQVPELVKVPARRAGLFQSNPRRPLPHGLPRLAERRNLSPR